jgi:hypothetical protein
VIRVLTALLRTVWLYALAGFAYVALTAVFRPGQLSYHIWPGLPVRKDTFGIVCFAASALAYLALGLMDKRAASR